QEGVVRQLQGPRQPRRPDLHRPRRAQLGRLKAYASYQECLIANQQLIQQGLQNPCTEEDDDTDLFKKKKKYYGPLFYAGSGSTRYVGYSGRYGGVLSGSGLTYDSKKGSYGSFKAPVSRGGLTSTARGALSSGG
ncbi:hypothetical protein CTI14_41615, partial [Methylobacterium radiotolerans]